MVHHIAQPQVFIMTNTIAINANSSIASIPARKRKRSTAALPEIDHEKVPPLSAFHAWRDNCDRLYIAWRADDVPFIATMYGPYNWFPFHREFWAKENSRDPLFRRILGRMVAHLSQALDLDAVPTQLPFDWDAEFECIKDEGGRGPLLGLPLCDSQAQPVPPSAQRLRCQPRGLAGDSKGKVPLDPGAVTPRPKVMQ
jgi:hypothetical protein